jgi:hypothetical protein
VKKSCRSCEILFQQADAHAELVAKDERLEDETDETRQAFQNSLLSLESSLILKIFSLIIYVGNCSGTAEAQRFLGVAYRDRTCDPTNLSREAEPRSLVKKAIGRRSSNGLLAEIKSAPVQVIESEQCLLDRVGICAGV